MRKNLIFKLGFVVGTLALLAGCSPTADDPQAAAIGRLNVVQALGLENAVRIEIMAFDLEDVDPAEDYIPVATVTSLEKVEELIFLLDGDLIETPALACIPEYRLRFWLEGGSQVDLGFSCQGAEFITGGQAVFQGRQFAPPAKFSGLIRSYFTQAEEETPAAINLLKAAQFGDVVRIEISEQTLGENTAEINSVLVIEDVEVIEEVLLALSGEFELHPQARCPVNYFISFTFDDDRTLSWGYMCGDDEVGILRGDQDYFFDQDIHLGAEFMALFARLVNP
jgi:hypothetical protein